MSKAKEEYYKSIFKKHLQEQERTAFDYIKELEEHNERLSRLIDYCCFDEDFDAQLVIRIYKKITGKSIEEVLKDA